MRAVNPRGGAAMRVLALSFALPACGTLPGQIQAKPTDTADTGADDGACVPEADSAGVCDARTCVEDVEPVEAEPIPHSETAVEDSDRFVGIDGEGCTTAAGDTRLDCADSVLTYLPAPVSRGYAPRWIGDLDGDGADDLVLQRGGDGDSFARVSAIFYGGGRVTSGPAESVADAAGEHAAGFAVGAGDLTGDGQDDVLVETASVDEVHQTPVGMAIHSTGRARTDAGAVQWSGGAAAWLAVDDDNVGFWPGTHNNWGWHRAQRAAGGDIDGDGIRDLVYSSTHSLELVARASIVKGASEMIASATQWEDATWRISTRRECVDWYSGSPATCSDLTTRPVPDIDGDGVDDVIVVRSGAMFGGLGTASGWSASVLSLAGTATCDFDLDDVMVNPVGMDAVQHLGLLAIGQIEAEALALSGAEDLNGDGLADIVLGGPTGEPNAWRNSLWFLYGGGEWLERGGELTQNPDRIDYPAVDVPYKLQPVDADMLGVSAMDLDGDAIDEVVLGSSAERNNYREVSIDAWVTIVPGTVGGLQGVHLWDDPELRAIPSVGWSQLTVPAGRGDLDADGFDDLVIMGLGPYQEHTEQLGAWIFYGGAIP